MDWIERDMIARPRATSTTGSPRRASSAKATFSTRPRAAEVERGLIYEREGAQWLRSQDLGDERDRVLIRSDGRPTYTATDIAYHYDKFLVRNFDRVIDVWGADHQGQVPSMKAIVSTWASSPSASTS